MMLLRRRQPQHQRQAHQLQRRSAGCGWQKSDRRPPRVGQPAAPLAQAAGQGDARDAARALARAHHPSHDTRLAPETEGASPGTGTDDAGAEDSKNVFWEGLRLDASDSAAIVLGVATADELLAEADPRAQGGRPPAYAGQGIRLRAAEVEKQGQLSHK